MSAPISTLYCCLMGWSDFDLDSALERDVLQRALPIVPTVSDGTRRAIVDQISGTAGVTLQLTPAVAGPTPAGCINLLGIRPLLVGAAWKVLDLLLETALDVAGQAPPNGRRAWHIAEKVAEAKKQSTKPAWFTTQAWRALMGTYVATEEIRHSLVHRNAYINGTNALVGHNKAGVPLRPLTVVEQEALARAALRAAELALAGVRDPRIEAALVAELGQLIGLHGITLPAIPPPKVVPEITVTIGADPNSPGNYLLDIPSLAPQRSPSGQADLIITTPDRPGQYLRGRLEDAPQQRVQINFDAPPAWLS